MFARDGGVGTLMHPPARRLCNSSQNRFLKKGRRRNLRPFSFLGSRSERGNLNVATDGTRIRRTGGERIQPHPGLRGNRRRPRNSRLRLPQGRARRLRLPARKRPRRREMGPLHFPRLRAVGRDARAEKPHRHHPARPRRRSRARSTTRSRSCAQRSNASALPSCPTCRASSAARSDFSPTISCDASKKFPRPPTTILASPTST